MKNVIATFAMLLVFVVIGVVGYQFFKTAPEPEKKFSKALNATEHIEGMLSVEKQETIWDAEHTTFEIEHRLGKAFLKAWVDGDGKKLASLFKSNLQMGFPSNEQWTVVSKPPLEERVRITTEETEVGNSNDLDLIQKLLGYLMGPIDGVFIDKKKLRVLKIKELENDQWKCRFLLAGSGLDKDGKAKLFQSEHDVIVEVTDEKQLGQIASIVEWKFRKEIIRTSSAPIMEETTASLQLDKVGAADNWVLGKGLAKQHNCQIAIEDFDQDHDLDISLMGMNGARQILAYEDGKYIDVTKKLGLSPTVIPTVEEEIEYLVAPNGEEVPISSRFATAWVDIDNDGFPELISGPHVFKNENGEKFTDITEQTGLKFNSETMGITVVDYDNDGFLDLYVIYQHGMGEDANAKWIDESESGSINFLYRNNGDGTFTDVTVATKSTGGFRHSHAAVWFYYDDDIYPDVYIANDFGRNVLLKSRDNGKYFEDVSDQSGADGFATSMGVVAGDVNNDGNADLYVANMFSKMGRRIIEMVSEEDYEPEVYKQIIGSCAGNQLYCRDESTGKYKDCGEMAGVNEVGWAWAPTMADIDSDGFLDLYSTCGFMSFDHEKPDG